MTALVNMPRCPSACTHVGRQSWQPFKPCQAHWQSRHRTYASADEPHQSGELTEDTLRKLEKAEAEAVELRKQLEEARRIQEERGDRPAAPRPRGPRIDGADLKRETLFGGKAGHSNWVQERDLEFFRNAADGPLEGGEAASAEEKATVQRRLILGLGLSAVAAGLALIPLEDLQPKGSKPLFFYLTPLIRIQNLLSETAGLVADAQWEDVRSALKRIEGSPNNLKDNLSAAAGALPDAAQRERARALATEIRDYIAGIDFNKYFDSMGGSKGGKQEQQFVEFSTASVKAAQAKLSQFLSLFPKDDQQAARDQAMPPTFQ